MQQFPLNYANAYSKHYVAPIYVIEIVFNDGKEFTPEGQRDIYFGTHDVSRILNFPYPQRYYPVLDAQSISGLTQKVDPINGVSSIGTLSFKLNDYNHYVSQILQATDAFGQGPRRQLCQLYMLTDGLDWADKVKVRTLYIEDCQLAEDGVNYVFTAADALKALKINVFNPFTTTLNVDVAATGAVTVNVTDTTNFVATPNSMPVYGGTGFIKIDNEIMQWTSKTATSFTVPATGRALFGSTMAAHTAGAQVSEIMVLRGNPVILALQVMTSTGATYSTTTNTQNGIYDVLPAHWGANLDATKVDDVEWTTVAQFLTNLDPVTLGVGTGLQFEFVIGSSVEAKKFIEDEICKIIGGFPRLKGDGRIGLVAYNDLANASRTNAAKWLTLDDVVKWGALRFDYKQIANEIWIDYDEYPPLSGKYIRTAIFVDAFSQMKWGRAKQLKYSTRGLIPDANAVSTIYQRFNRVMARYSRPPMRLNLTLLPQHHDLEVGDIVRVTLPIHDLYTGTTLDRAFEVLTVGLDMRTGNVNVELIAQPERATFWWDAQGAVATVDITPANVTLPPGNTQQLTARAFDANGNQVPNGAPVWQSDNTAVATVDANGLVTAVANGTANITCIIAGVTSNTCIVTVQAVTAGVVASVSVAPPSASLAPGNTQQMAATAYDVNGVQVPGATFTWASSNTAVATVDATGLVTAVANGTANITATETVSGVVSPQASITVQSAPAIIVPTNHILDSAYKVGTQITTMGPVGGPHTIPNGHNFAAGDYWFDGDVILPAGNTCYINGTVRIFSLGTITIDGVINGVGRGTNTTPYKALNPAIIVGGAGGYYSIWGNNGANADRGFCSKGGTGGTIVYPSGLRYKGGTSAPVDHNTPPTITPSAGATDANGNWKWIAGLPTRLHGAAGGSGAAAASSDLNPHGGVGGAGGAGLCLVARGIYVVNGQIDLSGGAGGNGVRSTVWPSLAMGGGGGGGGSFAAFSETTPQGIQQINVVVSRVIRNGGAAGANAARNWTASSAVQPTSGGTGAFYAQSM